MIDDEDNPDYYGDLDGDADEMEGFNVDPFFGESDQGDADEGFAGEPFGDGGPDGAGMEDAGLVDAGLVDAGLEDAGLASAATGGGELGGDSEALLADLIGGGGQDELAWRETYFVLFEHDRRPTLTQVEHALTEAGSRMTIENLEADDDGLFQSLLVQSPQDNAAIEISYESGDAVMEQSAELAKQLGQRIEGDQLALLMRADARLDVMHFEQMHEQSAHDADEPDTLQTEALDPAALITVVEALSHLTGGLPVDPAAGELLD